MHAQGTSSRTALITGASRGLGRALAGALAAAGWRLVIDARSAADLAAVRDALAAPAPGRAPGAGRGDGRGDGPGAGRGDGPGPGSDRVLAVPGDVTDPGHRAALLAAARSFGGPDLLINNAGSLGPSPLPALGDLTSRQLRDVLEANVVAPLALTRALLPDLRARRGAVLSVTSDAAVEAYPGWGAYGLSKAALERASAVLADEEPDLAVWWVDPGDMRTRMHADAFPGEDISDRPLPGAVVPAFLRLIAERLPSGRYRAADLLPPDLTASVRVGAPAEVSA